MECIKDIMNEEHDGFAITLEVMLTIALVTLFMMLNVYILAAMSAMRYTNTLATGAASLASRWGGNFSSSYKSNVSETDSVEKTFQDLLGDVELLSYSKITVTPDTVKDTMDEITVSLEYKLSNAFTSINNIAGADMQSNRIKTITIRVKSIMQPGGLLN